MEIRVAGAQLALQKNVAENTAKILAAIERAAAAKADILLTPEGGLSGYTPEFDQAAVKAGLGEMTKAAQQVGVWPGVGHLLC
jgi:predicted amidohydrolase